MNRKFFTIFFLLLLVASLSGAQSQDCENVTLVGIRDFEMAKIDDFVISYKDKGRNAVAVNAGAYKNRYGATEKVFEGLDGYYDVVMTTLTEIDGESTYRLKIGQKLIGEFQNPASEKDMSPYTYTFENILIKKGEVLQIASNTHSNGKIPEGDGFAFSRGRWRSIDFRCTGQKIK